jgi:hypothetical protein
LISVAYKFLDDVELPTPEIRTNLSIHMAEEHLSVTESSIKYFATQGRFNYVTPKSFLELIGFYKFLLNKKRANVMRLIERLDVGLSTLRKTAADVAELQIDLSHRLEVVAEKQIATNILIEEIGVQRADADVQNELANQEAEKEENPKVKAAIELGKALMAETANNTGTIIAGPLAGAGDTNGYIRVAINPVTNVAGGTIAFITSGYTVLFNDSFDLATFGGTVSGTPTFDFSGASTQAYGMWDTSAFASTGVITYVPETHAALLGSIGLMCLLRRRRL